MTSRAMTLVAALTVVATVLAPGGASAAEQLSVIVLAVGQSDAVLFEGPCGERGLIDAGAGDDDYVLAELDRRGSRALAWMSVSHYDADHVGDIADIGRASGVTVGAVYDRGGGRDAKDTITYRDYYDWVTGQGIRQPVAIGDVFSLCAGDQQVTFTVVSVGTDGTAVDGVVVSEENDRGVCVKVEWRDFDLASCGDVNGTDEGSRADVESAVADDFGDVEVAKVNHHGSRFSSNQTYVSTLLAQVSVISVGSNSFGHPSAEVVARWVDVGDVFQTRNSDGSLADGDVTVTTDGSSGFNVTTSASNVARNYSLDEDSAGGGTTARARATDDSCPPGEVPEDGFSDVPQGYTHETAVDCVVWWEIAAGTGGGRYSPTAPVSRAQMATFIANLVTQSGGSLPASPSDHFDDDDGSPHEPNINKLAEAGVVGGTGDRRYDPTGTVSRAQMATFLVKAYEYRTSETLSSSQDYFTDDSGSPHESNINKAAEAGFTGGTGGSSYSPAATLARGPMASFLARVLDLLVERGHTTFPGSDGDGGSAAPTECPSNATSASSSVEVGAVLADPEGDDLAHNGGEYVRLDNTGSSTVDVSNWSLCDEANHLIVIPDGYQVEAGTSLYVHTGTGDPNADRYFAGRSQAVWNNAGDTAELYNSSQQLVDTHSY